MKKLFLTLIAFVFVANLSAQIEVKSTGVGIGTTNPQYPLDVNGDARVAGSIYLKSNGIGIGVANPQYSLDVAGGARITGDAHVGGDIYLSGFSIMSSNGFVIKTDDVLTASIMGYYDCVSFGYGALNNYYGYRNVAVGFYALNNNAYRSQFNTAIGSYALYSNTTGYENTAIGAETLYNNSTGIYNVAIGNQALYNNTTGMGNTANGYDALHYNTTGSGNTANGSMALWSNTTGDNNTANGIAALVSNTTGIHNVAIGSSALSDNITGSQNIAIGYKARGIANNLNNAIAIGSEAIVTSSNQVRIGNSSITSIGGQVAWSTLSDGRAKKNITANVPGLAFINGLRPVTYNVDLSAMDALLKKDQMNIPDSLMRPLPQELIDFNNKSRAEKEKQIQTGFVAQDVQAAAKSLGYDFSGVEVDESGIYSLRYGEFVVPLVKAVQELSEQNNRLQQQVNELTLLVNKLLGSEAAATTQDK